MTEVVALTGASGFVGSGVLHALPRGAFRVIAVSRSSRPAEAEHVEWMQSSLEALSPRQWTSTGASRIDVLIHLAAFTPKSSAQRNQWLEIMLSNVTGLQRLLESLPNRPRRTIFASTLDVYCERAFEDRVNESSPTGPASLYGASKLFGESLVSAYCDAAGAESVSLRLGHVYGPGEDRYSKLIPETIRRVLRGEPPRVYGDGAELRDFLYLDDAAEAVARAATCDLRGQRVINVARGESVSVRKVVEVIAREAGYHGSIEVRQAAGKPLSMRFDTRRMESTLGFRPTVPLEEGLRREIAWFRERA